MRTASAFNTPVLPLLQTVLTAILEVFLLCLVGYILAGRGVLDKRTQKQLNRVNISLFTPCLLFSKVAFFLSPEKLRDLWIIPIFFVLVTTVSMVVSFVLGTVFRLKPSQKSFAIAASMFMNSNSLPIALMQSLVATVPGLKWDEDDNKNAMLGRALSYLVMYSTFGMVLRWSVGVRLLSQADPESTNELASESAEADPLLQTEESLPRSGIHRHESSCSCSTRFEGEPQNAGRSPSTITEDTQRLRPPPPSRPAHFFYSFPNTPNPSQVRIGFDPTSVTTTTAVSAESTNGGTDFSDSDTDDEVPIELRTGLRFRRRRIMAEPTSTRFQSIVRRTRHRISRFWNALNDFMTVPLWAALASLIVACTQPLQHALEVHMPAVKSALGSAGNCSIPVTLIVLGAYFHSAPNPAQTNNVQNGVMITTKSAPTSSLLTKVKRLLNISGRDRVVKRRAGETRTVVISVLSRMVITPLLILPMMVLSTKFSLHSLFDDPVFVIVNVLLIASPPALTLAQITQAAAGDAFERLISRTIFWSYCIVTPPTIIISVVIGLLITKL